jgi:predicted amidohydrolase YtcJ
LPAEPPLAATRIFQTGRIVTMNPSLPIATHVAVRDCRILGIGGPELVDAFGPAILDDRFTGNVIVPGFVEGHGHAADGLMWRNPYAGYFPRTAPGGSHHAGFRSIAEMIARLRQIEAAMTDPDRPLVAWGFDPIYFDGPRLTVTDLDAISTRRMIVVAHVSGHILNVNSVVLERAGFSADSNLQGLVRDAAGQLTGELQGPAVMGRANRITGEAGLSRELDVAALRDFAALTRRVGVTTSTDLANPLPDETVAALQSATAEKDFPLRLVPALRAREFTVPDGIARIKALQRLNTERLHFGIAKLVVDGSIQGFTARLRWPGYHNGAPNGLWYIAPAELGSIIEAYHRAGIQLHIHTNGDEASELATEMIGRAVSAYPRLDHRHTLQHCQMADEAIFRRMHAFGMCVNLFANHIYYWGEQHRALTVGPSRAQRMNACGTALKVGVPLAIHSDTPVTPVDPLFTMWCAVNRVTARDRVLGPHERVTPEQALHAVTLGPAYTLHLDHLIGSIDVGKFADFAVLDRDPLAIEPMQIRDIKVRATVSGGRVFDSA